MADMQHPVVLACKRSMKPGAKERFVIDGATSVAHIDTDIVDGDGDPTFRCSSGHLTFDGVTPGPTGFGGYRGVWIHGCP